MSVRFALRNTRITGPFAAVRSRITTTDSAAWLATLRDRLMHTVLAGVERFAAANALWAVTDPRALGGAAAPEAGSIVSRVTLAQAPNPPLEKSSANRALIVVMGSEGGLAGLVLFEPSVAVTV